MATPVRYPSGISTDQVWQPLAQAGFANPFLYHVLSDDFDGFNTGLYTSTLTGNGTVANTAIDGGAILFTTNSTTPATTDLAAVQAKAAGFAFVPQTATTAGKKSFFLARIQVSDAVNAAFNVGLMNTTSTAFAPTDGLYFNKATGSASNLQVVSMVGSAATTITIPTSTYTLANGTNIDLGLYYDGRGNVAAFVNGNMIGFMANSGTGASQPNRGPVATFQPSLTTALLNPTLAVQSGTATSKTMQVDLLLAARER